MDLVQTRHLFLTGKGGVGKTSLACAMAIRLADKGKKVLLVSTDPASNLDDVLETHLVSSPVAIEGVRGLWALNLDPEEAARAYRENVVGAYRGVLPDSVVKSMEEQLSGACTVEIATFELFTHLLVEPDQSNQFDHIVFDTAPTGHTLRLLSLPKAWSGFLEVNVHGGSCIGPLAGLAEQRQRFERAVSALSDSTLTTLVLVARPDTTSLVEAARASRELSGIGMQNQHLVVNGILESSGDDPVVTTLKQQQDDAMRKMPSELCELGRSLVPLMSVPPVGIPGLCALSRALEGRTNGEAGSPSLPGRDERVINQPATPHTPTGLRPIVSELSQQETGVVLVMGKGGVGKTTVAAAVALALAEGGKRVHLSTTDPAAHLEMTLLGGEQELPANLTVDHIDPAREVAAYREEVMSVAGADLDEEGRALLAEDLASPCTEEIAVFRAFARTVSRVEDGFVVLDTAPTGHTLLLLDATQSYHREVQRNETDVPPEVRRLLPRLRDPKVTHVLIVTLAQATPVFEASRLQSDLLRGGIEPDWWIINQTWTGVTTSDPTLVSLARSEQHWLEEVVRHQARKVVRIPWQVRPPRGVESLHDLYR